MAESGQTGEGYESPSEEYEFPTNGSEHKNSSEVSDVPGEGFEQPDSSSDHQQLLFTSASGASHMWRFTAQSLGLVRFRFRGQSAGGCAECEEEYRFSMHVGESGDGSRGEVKLETDVTLFKDILSIGELVMLAS
jgi:hypothetical protein